MSSTRPLSAHPTRTGSGVVGTAVRLAAAVLVYLSGLIHLQLYFDSYRDFPDANLGRSILLNVLLSVGLAIALLLRREVIVRLAAAALLVATLIAFIVSRTDTGIFGFTETGLNPSPQAALALCFEIAGLVLLAATFVRAIGPGDPLQVGPAAVIAVVAVAVAVGGGALWAQGDATSPTAEGSGAQGQSTISIAGFAFHEPTLTVPVGTTVEWVNNDSTTHSIVAEDGSFLSPDLAPGETFTFTFDTAGTFGYLCGIHPQMRGEITVTG